MGSPRFAVPCLEVLRDHTDLRLVITQPDQPAGRGRKLTPPPVKAVAESARLPVLQPFSIRKPPLVSDLVAHELDLIVVVAYGKILPPELLALPRRGCWNIHASLLPRWRGAAPIQHALLAGDRTTGVTLMQMDEGMDTGEILLQTSFEISDVDTSGALHDRLATLGAELLKEGIARQAAESLIPASQSAAGVTLAPPLEKGAGRIDWRTSAVEVRNRIRAVDPWPGAFTTLGAEPLKLWSARTASGQGRAGAVLGADRSGLIVACGEGAVAIAELQLPGRKRLPASALLAGRPIPVGTRLGEE